MDEAPQPVSHDKPLDNAFTLQKLEILCAVVAHGGVGRAADELFVSQPVVSAHIRSLEDKLGTRLFEKDGRGIRLTEAGEQVHRWALDVLRSRRELSQTLQHLRGGTAGSVAVAASMSAANSVLTPILIDFRRAFRDVRVSVTNSSVEVALELTQSGRADFCLVGSDAVLDSRAYEAELVGRPSFVLIASVEDTTVPDRVSATDLATLPFITPPAGLAIRRSQEAALAELGVHNRRVELELGSAEAIMQAVVAGLGVALLWRISAAAELASGALREVHIDGTLQPDKLYVVTRAGKRLTPAQRQLKQAIVVRTPGLVDL
ncbi:LysR family transcriptional regulator [Nocardioides piscis]|uniref:LysR family transcriptional regulator n=1 Tax=Nocardioides piscis TaxID=2714938 RepID=A0A6G7YDL3_9ACTN|nr:LysR family transcriptional regulator [Nocardioides piscis]QIK74731.1 LysR family transcriptional regulator [Nocardioides piscis]